MIYCTQCGNENDDASKFCRNCGAKLEQTAQSDGVFSSEGTEPAYEKITDAEEEKPTAIPSQDNFQNSYESSGYGSDNTGSGVNNYYETPSSQYYSANQNEQKQGGGNIGFAIASLVCGILSLVCCCLTLFSVVLGLAAVILGIITIYFKYDGKGMAIAGIATGGIGLLIGVVAFVWSGSTAAREFIDYLEYEYY